jgi:hypothetical protein
MIRSHTEIDFLDEAMTAARRLFKFCRAQDPELFTTEALLFVGDFLRGEIQFLNGRLPHDFPGISDIVQPVMEFVGQVFAARPAGIDELCEHLLSWASVATQLEAFPIIGALGDAVEFCPISDELVTHFCRFITELAPRITDIDLQHTVSYIFGMLLRKFPREIGMGMEVLPVVMQWWNRGLEKSGCEELVSNIASFFLSCEYVKRSTINEPLLVECVRKFPPDDIGETNTQIELLCFLTPDKSARFQLATAVAFSKLFTEGETENRKRKILPDLHERGMWLFRGLMENDEIRNDVISLYHKQKQKTARIIRFLGKND